MPKPSNRQLIAETLAMRSGYSLLARDIATIISHTYGRSISPKSVSKNIPILEEHHPMITKTRPHKKHNCRYIYTWGNQE